MKMNQQLNVPDLSRNQATKSQSPEDILHFKRRVIQARRKVEERRMINFLKARLVKVFKNGNRKSCVPKYSLQLEGVLSEMLAEKKRLVLVEVYALVFHHNLHYQHVYRAMYELMGEPQFQKLFEECMWDSFTMLIYAIHEQSRTQKMLIQPDSLLSKIRNSEDFSRIEFLTKPKSL